MGKSWKTLLHTDPLPALRSWPDPALAFFIRRDLLEEPVGPLDALWELPQPCRLVNKQQADGSWRNPGRTNYPAPNANYNLLETYRSLRLLVEMYGFRREQPALARAADYVFTGQTKEGDIRGILRNQYMPYYHGAILELLGKSG
jgi:hypothetical protein